MRILRVHHLTLAVGDIDRAQATFASLFGLTLERDDMAAAFGVRTRDLALGEDVLQLAQPLQPDSPVMRFIERKGEGVYAVALEVDDLDAAVEELASKGVRVSPPVEATPGVRSAFVAMAATHGLSVQLVEVARIAAPAADPAESPAPLPLPAPAPVGERAPSPAEVPPPPLDLTPDEWSDVD
jgi:methylmalonyl-CoA/ethylmalonyl-CoA epimerase